MIYGQISFFRVKIDLKKIAPENEQFCCFKLTNF